MSRYNLHTLKQHMLYLLEQRFGPEASQGYPEVQLFDALNRAQDMAQDRLRWAREFSTSTVDLTADTYVYDLPVDVLGTAITEVRVLDDDGETWSDPLTRLTPGQMRDNDYLDPGTPSRSGEPERWTLDEANGRLILSPTPDYSESSGLWMRYQARPTPLFRLYAPSDETAAVTAGSTSATLSADPGSSVAVGDAIGVIATTQSDGTNNPARTPLVWHGISAISGTSVTLDSVALQTVTASAYVTAQVPWLEQLRPGRLGYSLAQMAVAELLLQRAPDFAETLRRTALGVWEGQKQDVHAERYPTMQIRTHTTFGRGW